MGLPLGKVIRKIGKKLHPKIRKFYLKKVPHLFLLQNPKLGNFGRFGRKNSEILFGKLGKFGNFIRKFMKMEMEILENEDNYRIFPSILENSESPKKRSSLFTDAIGNVNQIMNFNSEDREVFKNQNGFFSVRLTERVCPKEMTKRCFKIAFLSPFTMTQNPF